jgi:hypothetical protein
MRVRIISGAKRVTVIGPKQPGTARTDRVTVQERHDYGAAEKLKFTVIKPTGEVQRGELLLDLGPIRRDSRPLRPLEKRMRQLVRAEYKALGRYLVLHDRSRRKRRNGWAKDFGSNLVKVIRHRN